MHEYDLVLKVEQAYDSLSGDIGSKKCAVVFPEGKSPEGLDQYVAEFVERREPGWHLIRRARAPEELGTRISAHYSSPLDLYCGQYVMVRSFLAERPVKSESIGGVILQAPPGIDEAVNLGDLFINLNASQQLKLKRLLAEVYGEDRDLDGLYVQVSCDAEFEAVSLSFLDPDDILCDISLRFVGDTRHVNEIVAWLGSKDVDFRHYHIVEGAGRPGYDFRLLCDLSQTYLHLFNAGTLREVLQAELSHCLRATVPGPGVLESVVVSFKNDTLNLYGKFSSADRFGLIAVVIMDNKGAPVRTWPAPLDPSVTSEDLEEARGAAKSDITTTLRLPVKDRRRCAVHRSLQHDATIIAFYENRPPQSFEVLFNGFCKQPSLPRDATEMYQSVQQHLFLGLNFDELVPTRQEFESLKDAPRERYRIENDSRFSSLGWHYMVEKWERDRFAFHGNDVLAGMLKQFVTNDVDPNLRRRLSQRSGSDKVRIADIGPGVGALTTALAIRRTPELWHNLEQIDLLFIDSAQTVLDLNKAASGLAQLPSGLLHHLQLLQSPDRDAFIRLLGRAAYWQIDVSDSEAISVLKKRGAVGQFDIVYSGFCHHHMNVEMKERACKAMLALAKDGAFVGICDECLTYKQFLLYRVGHSRDQVPIATESYFQQWEEHRALLGEHFKPMGHMQRARTKFYAFWGRAQEQDAPKEGGAGSAVPIVSQRRRKGESGLESLVSILEGIDSLRPGDYSVAARYVRYDEKIRNLLKLRVKQIQDPLRQKTSRHENFLVWAAPGSGKTFLIEQAAAELGNSVKYIDCNLGRDSKEEFLRKLNEVGKMRGPVLCLLDEIDAKPTEAWPYDQTFSALDLNLQQDKQVVFVLVGSGQASVEALAEYIKSRVKGKDMIRRIPDAGFFEIPVQTLHDSLVVSIAEIVSLRPNIRSIEKLALLYTLSNGRIAGSPAQLTDFLRAASRRMGMYDTRLLYDHLFDPGAQDRRVFSSRVGEDLIHRVEGLDIKTV